MKTITAVITTFLRPHTLSRALDSVLGQRTPPNELLVIDNAGDKETELIVSRLSKSSSLPIRYIVEEKRGVSAARNRGIKESIYDYVAFLDDDDVWLANHLEDFQRISHGIDNIALFGGMRGRLADPNELIFPDSEQYLRDYSTGQDLDISVRPMGRLSRPFFTPSMSESIVDVVRARKTLFDEELLGREDIHFVWRLGETGHIVLHHCVHGLADQLETSLFSVVEHASDSERLKMDLKKVRYGVLMLEKITATVSSTPELLRALGSAYFASAYVNSLAGNTKTASDHFIRSARIKLDIKHLKLAIRVAISPFFKSVASAPT